MEYYATVIPGLLFYFKVVGVNSPFFNPSVLLVGAATASVLFSRA